VIEIVLVASVDHAESVDTEQDGDGNEEEHHERNDPPLEMRTKLAWSHHFSSFNWIQI